ncbi:MAG: hypothetical protein V1733_10990 [bacterium]
MRKVGVILLGTLLILTGCNRPGSRLDTDVSGIAVDPVRIHRYDQALFRTPLDQLPGGLARLKSGFPFFLGTDLTDTSKLFAMKGYLTNARNIEFYKATEKKYPDLNDLEKELTEAFRRLRYYYPDALIPRVYTYISGGEYDSPVGVFDSVLLIALDAYLGADFKPYAADGLPLYRIQRMNQENMLPDCIRAIEHTYYPVLYPGNTLLDQLIEAGKRIYFVDAMIPDYPDRFKIGYTPEQMAWAEENESHVWAAIIENQLLYSAKGSTIRTFLADGPFTADFSAESPPRLGEYIGWQIVKAWMERNKDVSLEVLLVEPDAQKILAGSKYKPGK